jgi:hypothetical protein
LQGGRAIGVYQTDARYNGRGRHIERASFISGPEESAARFSEKNAAKSGAHRRAGQEKRKKRERERERKANRAEAQPIRPQITNA